MKAKVLLLSILFGSALSLSAQEYQPQVGFSTENGSKTNFKKNKATDNMFISIAGGANVLLGDYNGDAEFSDRIAPQGAISIGKWYNPYMAFRLQVNGGLMNNYNGALSSDQELKWINPHVDIMWDVTNFWAPYKEAKVFRFIPFVGIGYAVRAGLTDDDGISYDRAESVSVNGGAQFMFRLSKRVDLFLEGQYTLLAEHWNDMISSTARPRYDRPVQAMLGLNFNLGRKEFEVIEPMDYALLNDLNSQINALRSRNAELEKRPEFCPECPPQIIQEDKEALTNVVYFRLNSAKIDKNQELNIFNTAEFAKKHGLPIKLVGYADKLTGNPDYNKGLSERRARAVAKQLIDDYGVSSNNISIEWKGDVVQPYETNEWNRVVIMDTSED